jgi:hypothetical protein
MEEFRRLAFEGVANELEYPSDEEQSQRVSPQTVEEDAGYKKRDREQDRRNAQRVTDAVHRVLMTGTVLRDPLLVGASAQHAEDNITISTTKKLFGGPRFSFPSCSTQVGKEMPGVTSPLESVSTLHA